MATRDVASIGVNRLQEGTVQSTASYVVPVYYPLETWQAMLRSQNANAQIANQPVAKESFLSRLGTKVGNAAGAFGLGLLAVMGWAFVVGPAVLPAIDRAVAKAVAPLGIYAEIYAELFADMVALAAFISAYAYGAKRLIFDDALDDMSERLKHHILGQEAMETVAKER